MALEVGMADTGKLILFSSVYLFLPPHLHFNTVSWEIPAEIYSLLRCFSSLAPCMPSWVWLWFVSGMEGKSSRTEELCSLSGARAYVPVKIPFRCYTLVVLWAQPLFHRNSKARRPCHRGLSSFIKTSISWALMGLPRHATESVWGLISIYISLADVS